MRAWMEKGHKRLWKGSASLAARIPDMAFDPGYYKNQAGSVAGMSCKAHYVAVGDGQLLDPHPLFDSRFYAAQLAVLRPGPRPAKPLLLHYLEVGERLGLRPHPLFDPRFYARRRGLAEGASAFLDYLSGGRDANLTAPHRLFDAARYFANGDDLSPDGINPLLHYVAYGWREGRSVLPGMRRVPVRDTETRDPLSSYILRDLDLAAPVNRNAGEPVMFPLFRPRHYLAQLGRHPALDVPGMSLLEHYLVAGEADGLTPHPLFDPAFVRAAGVEPEAEGSVLESFLEGGPAVRDLATHRLVDMRLLLTSRPDIDPQRVTVMLNYLNGGWRKGGRLNALFDPQHYMAQLPAEERTGEPFSHYLSEGEARGLSPHPLFAPSFLRAAAEAAGKPAAMSLLEWYVTHPEAWAAATHPLFDGAYYVEQLKREAPLPLPPLAHYLLAGSCDGVSACPVFDLQYYERRYRSELVDGRDPLIHYASHGVRHAHSCFAGFAAPTWTPRSPADTLADHPVVAFMRDGWDGKPRARSLQLPGEVPWLIADVQLAVSIGAAVLDQTVNAADVVFRTRTLIAGEAIRIPFFAWADAIHRIALPLIAVAGSKVRLRLLQERTGQALFEVDLTEGQPIPHCQLSKSQLSVAVPGGIAVKAGERYLIELTALADHPVSGVALRVVPYQDQHIPAALPRLSDVLNQPPVIRPERLALTRERLEVVLLIAPYHPQRAAVDAFAQQRFADCAVRCIDLGRFEFHLRALLDADIVVFADVEDRHFGGPKRLSSAIQVLMAAGCTTVFLSTVHGRLARETWNALPALQPVEVNVRRDLWRIGRECHYIAEAVPGTPQRWYRNLTPGTTEAERLHDAEGLTARALYRAVWPETLPHVVVVSVLYKKAEVVGTFLRAINRQTYGGPMTVVLVDDCSPDDSARLAEEAIAAMAGELRPNLSVRLLRNDTNMGNCLSRNRGIAAVEGDIYTIIDCDCLLNADFVAAHVWEHLIEPTDAVVGPLNLESGKRDAWALMLDLEKNPDHVLQEMNMQDDIQPDGFVNSITRNFSIKRRWFGDQPLFDPDFSYSAKPDSGFGWEDVEMGCRLYAAGAYIRFTRHAFSLHQTHGSSVPEQRQAAGSARNYNRLFQKHPEAAVTARRWATRTAQRILEWCERLDLKDSLDYRQIEARFARPMREIAPLIRSWDRKTRRLRVLTYRWHVPHQYEIYKLPHAFTLVTQAGTGFTNSWDHSQRPRRRNVRLLPADQVNFRDYDVAILHFDENVLCSELSNNRLPPDWGATFRWFLDNVPLPKVAVCHGTVPFYGQYGADPEEIAQFVPIERERLRLVRDLAGIPVVCNSWQAAREWGFADSRVIWHGLDPQEFPAGTHERAVVAHATDWDRPHYRGAHMMAEVRARLAADGIAVAGHGHDGVALRAFGASDYGSGNFRAWIDHLRRHKVYLNTTRRSPMPRSRTEAMLCGTIPVSLNNHDVSAYIRNGINGFYGDSAEELVDQVRFLCRNEAARVKISAAARATAIDLFNHDRFLSEWVELLDGLAR